MSKRIIVRSVIIFLVLAVMLISVYVTARILHKPPTDKLHQAYKAISKAKTADGVKYAPDLLAQAEKDLSDGEKSMAEESRQWLPFGSYREAESLLTLAIVKADNATKKAHANKNGLYREIEQNYEKLKTEASAWRRKFDTNLTGLDSEKRWKKVQTNLEVAGELMMQKQYLTAKPFLKQVDSLLKILEEQYNSYLQQSAGIEEKGYKWVEETINESVKTGKTALIVDKSAHKLFVLKKGKVTSSYACDLGFNSAYQKLMSGDGATPEGKYQVTMVKMQSKYYKALLLNYPNESDQTRFADNKRKGIISEDAKIGSLIEIHGSGTLKKDWTDGCVALLDKDMDLLLKDAGLGTRVTIVRKSNIGDK